MPPPEGKTGDLCIWFITCIFLVFILSGGIFLVIYIRQPDSDEIGWILATGMVLISIPWIFWILICLYRSVIPCYKQPPADSQLHSPGGEKRVRFGAATVIELQDDSGVANGAAARNADGSSLGSHESEVPFAIPIS
ncbi:uncharacterized protein LOC110018152 [Phalaenopsis equestris]|uniref:uncharacterized protein LOC110018152 n=1 Tax=Phalaenopsis equestris TaxID=78828 RepID=UPI0009E5543A|nr:uncharacterized protein LOC110018152 [Phalaenopsis equestris]